MKQDILLFGGVNKDSSILEQGDYLDALSLTNKAKNSTSVNKMEVVLGNEMVDFDRDFSGRNKVIGSCVDEGSQSIYYFVWNEDDFHHILRYTASGVIQKVVYPDGTAPLDTASLGFIENPSVFKAIVLNDELIWTTGGELRMVYITKAYNLSNGAVVSDIERYPFFRQQPFLLQANPPLLPPVVQYQTHKNYTGNNLRGRLFQFSYRYTYLNDEVSVLSEYSNVPLPQEQEETDGTFVDDETLNNVIEININTGNYLVKKVEIFARELNLIPDVDAVTGGWYKVKTIDKYDMDGGLLIVPNLLSFNFYNDVSKIREDQQNMGRLFDFIPRNVNSLSLLDQNKVIVGDYLEGYDPIDIDLELEPIQKTIAANTLETELFYGLEIINLEPGDELAQIPPTNAYYGWTKFPQTIQEGDTITIDISDGVNSYSTSHVITGAEAASYPSLLKSNLTAEIALAGITIPIDSDVKSWHREDNYLTFCYIETFAIYGNILETLGWEFNTFTYEGNARYKFPSWKKGAYHQFGIVYKDELKRQSSVLINDDTKIYVKFDSQEPYIGDTYERKFYQIKYTINHEPPSWAKTYSIVYFPRTTINNFFQSYYKVNRVQSVSNSTVVSNNDIRFEDGRYYIAVNNAIDAQNEAFNGHYPSYRWQPKDRIRIYGSMILGSGKVYYLNEYLDYEIIGEEFNAEEAGTGIYEIVVANDLNLSPNYFNNPFTTDKGVLFEIYSPAIEMENKIGYEIETHQIEDGYHTAKDQDQTSTLPAIGTIDGGNSYTFIRAIRPVGFSSTIYQVVESEHFSDYYASDAYNYGRVNVVSDSLQEKRFFSGLRYSEQALQGTRINGLSTWLYDSFNNLEERFGSITLIESVGEALKIRQQYKSVSFYVGKSFLKTADGTDIPVESVDRILGGKHTTPYSYGVQHPFGYARNDRHEYFFDVASGVVVRDSANGMFPISSYGMDSYWKEMANKVRNDGFKVIAGFDKILDSYILTIMNDTTSDTITWMFCESDNKWKGRLPHFNPNYGVMTYPPLTPGQDPDRVYGPCRPERYEYIGDTFVSFIKGNLFVHNTGEPSVFYNYYHNPEIRVRFSGDLIKHFQFRALEIATDCEWSAPEFGDISVPATSTTKEMVSRLKSLEKKGGKLHKNLLMNACTTSDTPSQEDLFNGDFLRGMQLDIRLESDTEERSFISSISVHLL